MTVKQLTDEQVADLADPSLDEIWGCEDVNTLAREVQEYRALRPPYPTCGGTCEVVVTQDGMGETVHAHVTCPGCTDGKMPLDKCLSLLVAALTLARESLWMHDDKHSQIDAVLKMAGVT